jgi:hypothetical protein
MRRFSSFFAVSILLGSCSLDLAHDYAVIVPWLINGVAPSQEQCRDHGVERVRFTVTSGDFSPLEGACGEGIEFDDGSRYGGFVTTDSFDFDERYEYVIEMIDAKGKVVDGLTVTDWFRVDYYGDEALPYLLNPLELFEPSGDVASFEGEWTAGDEVGAGCQALGISEVVLWVTSFTDPTFANAIELASAPCGDGHIASDGAVLAAGDYLLMYEALAASGARVDASDAIEAIVEEPGLLTIDTVRFDGL